MTCSSSPSHSCTVPHTNSEGVSIHPRPTVLPLGPDLNPEVFNQYTGRWDRRRVRVGGSRTYRRCCFSRLRVSSGQYGTRSCGSRSRTSSLTCLVVLGDLLNGTGGGGPRRTWFLCCGTCLSFPPRPPRGVGRYRRVIQ